jgi:hypothetical protein
VCNEMVSNSNESSNDIDRALQSMADDIHSLDDATSDHCVPDLVYCDTEPIQGLMTTEFSGAFSEETISTASAMLLPAASPATGSPASSSHLSSSCAQTCPCPTYFQPTDASSTSRMTADASTNTVEDEILACTGLSDDKLVKIGLESSVGTQTITPVGSPQSDSEDRGVHQET